MKRSVFLVLTLLLIPQAPGLGSPLTAKHSLRTQKSPEGARVAYKESFRGGERACVIVKGDHKPVVNLEIAVYDQKGNLVAKDNGGGDYVAAIWYPPRDGLYKIEIFNPGEAWNACYISVK